MRYRKLGRTGLFVSELCLGTMTFGGESGIWSQIGYVRDVLICPLAVGNETGIPKMRGCDHVFWVPGSVIEKGRMSKSACS